MIKTETNPYTRILESDPFEQGVNNILYYQNISICLNEVAQHYNTAQGEDLYMGYSELSAQVQSLSDLYSETNHNTEDIKELKNMIHTEFCSVLVDLENHYENFPDEISNRDIEFGKIFLQAFIL